jgi:hypothetical protein
LHNGSKIIVDDTKDMSVELIVILAEVTKGDNREEDPSNGEERPLPLRRGCLEDAFICEKR